MYFGPTLEESSCLFYDRNLIFAPNSSSLFVSLLVDGSDVGMKSSHTGTERQM